MGSSGYLMQVTQTHADGLNHAFKIVVPAGDIDSKVEDRLKEVALSIKIPGFRPGKVPLSVVRKRYESSVKGEVLEKAVQESVRSTLDEKKLTPAVQPKIEVVAFDVGKDLEFTLEFEALPEIDGMDFSSLHLTKRVVRVDDGDVDKALERIAESRKTNEPVKKARKSKKGDVLEIDFVGRVDGEEFPGGKAESYDLELGSGAFIPGFEEQLIGVTPGADVQVTVTFPEEYHAKDLAGKEVVFDVNVKALKQVKLPDIDDDFAKSIGLDDLDALKKAVREKIESDYAGLVRDQMKRQLLDELAGKVSFPVPQSMVDAEFSSIWSEIEVAQKSGTLDDEDKDKSEDALRADYRSIAERRVRLGLFLADAGRKAGVQVTQADVNRAIMREASRYPGQEQAVFSYFQKDKKAVDRLSAPIYEDKVVDMILEKVTVEEQSVQSSDLLEEQSAPQKEKKKAARRKPLKKDVTGKD